MGYDEKIFKAKANIKARRLWLVFAILLTANYGTDTVNGAYSVSNYIIFVIFHCHPPILIIVSAQAVHIFWKYIIILRYTTLLKWCDLTLVLGSEFY